MGGVCDADGFGALGLARADAEQNVIQQEAEGRAQAARIRAIAEAEASAIRQKAQALMDAGQAYLDLRRSSPPS